MRGGWLRSLASGGVVGGFLLTLSGCAIVPRSQMEQSRKTDRLLRTQLAEAKDDLAKLKARNRDLLARSTTDGRRVAALEEANERFEHDIAAYQEEREQYAAALDQIKSRILASSGTPQKAARLDHP